MLNSRAMLVEIGISLKREAENVPENAENVKMLALQCPLASEQGD